MSSTPSTLIPLWKDFSYFTHQEDGIRWMLEKEKTGTSVPTRDGKDAVVVRGGFQCDDMGLGKTIQIAATMANHPKKATLLIAPLAMIETWAEVCQRAGMKVYEVVKGEWALRVVPYGDGAIPRHFMKCRPTVYISNYEKLYHSFSLFSRGWDRVVLDEAHKIRNGSGQVAVYARKVVAPIRWVVTGTPLVNSPKDVVSLLGFVGVPVSPLWSWEVRLNDILPQLVLHRSLNSLRAVIKGAPPIPEIHQDILPFSTEDEDDFYHGIQSATESMMAKYGSEHLSPFETLKLLLRLRQISVHPQVYINAKRRETPTYARKNWTAPSTKVERVKNIISQDTTDKVHKYIIFCQFIDEMALMRESLLDIVKDANILMYHGGMNQAERTAVLATSKKTTETTVLLLQLQAGGVGLNLQEYDRIIFVSPWWTAALMDQAIARAVRMGQTEVVKVYHLQLAAEKEATINIDVMINRKADEKRKMLENMFLMCETYSS
jgi:SNF2 family DNA or RNA helicase